MNEKLKTSTMPTFFESEEMTALEAISEAQKIAFGPIVFQAVRLLRDKGILSFLVKNREVGSTESEIAQATGVSEYGVRVLLESGLGAKVCHRREGRYFISKVGLFFLNDKMTKVNMDFVQDVCYKAMWHLEDSIDKGSPEGLKELGPWETIYQGLSILPEPALTSWFNFDHFYSDQVFNNIMPIIFENAPQQIFDIGGNTGKFSIACCDYNKDVKVTICDLAVQLEHAQDYLGQLGYGERVKRHQMNVLESNLKFPDTADVIMMSQFLDCFSEAEIIHILKEVQGGLNPDGSIFILETYWDRQKFEISAFCLQQTSLYFTAIANGNSKMYHSDQMKRCIEAAGLKVELEVDGLGISHTLFKCKLNS